MSLAAAPARELELGSVWNARRQNQFCFLWDLWWGQIVPRDPKKMPNIVNCTIHEHQCAFFDPLFKTRQDDDNLDYMIWAFRRLQGANLTMTGDDQDGHLLTAERINECTNVADFLHDRNGNPNAVVPESSADRVRNRYILWRLLYVDGMPAQKTTVVQQAPQFGCGSFNLQGLKVYGDGLGNKYFNEDEVYGSRITNDGEGHFYSVDGGRHPVPRCKSVSARQIVLWWQTWPPGQCAQSTISSSPCQQRLFVFRG